jgi:predicted hotdog family 3-hydroxylacyl-ACP dehydratase
VSIFDIYIEDLIPHRNRMKLIDEIVELDDAHCVTAATVSPGWPLVEDGHIDPIILIELAAQTAGVSFGWHEYRQGKPTSGRLGWLVGIKNAVFYTDAIPMRARITMTVEGRKNGGTYAEISCTALVGSEAMARMQLQVFRTESS